jgi:A/G-specific adenine glycosylase
VKNELANKLLKWYSANKRSFPWREDPQPYAVWVAEIMAQQTRLETMLPYYQRWMERYPTVRELATATQQEVLGLWEGLGYYGRARNLHKAAQVVVSEYNGELPASVEELLTLPGIGRYTAGAIASIAFGADQPVVDGNIKRVLARVFAISEAVNTSTGEKRVWSTAEEQLPQGRAGDYNQALMDLGALVCLPRQPRCEACPLADLCKANELKVQEEFPVKQKRAMVPHYTVTAAVLSRGEQVLIAQRKPNELLGGMWEFPGGKQKPGESLENCLKREIKEELGVKIEVGEQVGVFRHAYTHFKVTLYAFDSRLVGGQPCLNDHQAIEWVSLAELSNFPMGKIDRQISQTLQSRGQQDEPEVPTAD